MTGDPNRVAGPRGRAAGAASVSWLDPHCPSSFLPSRPSCGGPWDYRCDESVACQYSTVKGDYRREISEYPRECQASSGCDKRLENFGKRESFSDHKRVRGNLY